MLQKEKASVPSFRSTPVYGISLLPCLYETLACVGWCVVTADGHIAGLAETLRNRLPSYSTRGLR